MCYSVYEIFYKVAPFDKNTKIIIGLEISDI